MAKDGEDDDGDAGAETEDQQREIKLAADGAARGDAEEAEHAQEHHHCAAEDEHLRLQSRRMEEKKGRWE